MNTSAELFPWLEPAWDKLQVKIRSQQFPHGIIIAGPKGIGKNQLASYLSQTLLCQSPQSNGPCGQCHSCQWFQSENHPDFYPVFPEGKSESIKVDAIRELCRSLVFTSHAGGFKVGLIHSAERMNLNAANSLLKSLEEPTPNTVFILVANQASQLPATIRSRCQIYQIQNLDQTQALAWLAEHQVNEPEMHLRAAQGAPLIAKEMAANNTLSVKSQVFTEFVSVMKGSHTFLTLVSAWEKLDLSQLYLWLSHWISDLIKSKFHTNPVYLSQPEQQAVYDQLNKFLELTLLFNSYELVTQAARLQHTSANKQLTLEKLLIQFNTHSRNR